MIIEVLVWILEKNTSIVSKLGSELGARSRNGMDLALLIHALKRTLQPQFQEEEPSGCTGKSSMLLGYSAQPSSQASRANHQFISFLNRGMLLKLVSLSSLTCHKPEETAANQLYLSLILWVLVEMVFPDPVSLT